MASLNDPTRPIVRTCDDIIAAVWERWTREELVSRVVVVVVPHTHCKFHVRWWSLFFELFYCFLVQILLVLLGSCQGKAVGRW